jgi:hypothetical protein
MVGCAQLMKEDETVEKGESDPGEWDRDVSNVEDTVLYAIDDIAKTDLLRQPNARGTWRDWGVSIGDDESNSCPNRHKLAWVVVDEVDILRVESGVASNA